MAENIILELKITEIIKFPSSKMSAESIHMVNTLAVNRNQCFYWEPSVEK